MAEKFAEGQQEQNFLWRAGGRYPWGHVQKRHTRGPHRAASSSSSVPLAPSPGRLTSHGWQERNVPGSSSRQGRVASRLRPQTDNCRKQPFSNLSIHKGHLLQILIKVTLWPWWCVLKSQENMVWGTRCLSGVSLVSSCWLFWWDSCFSETIGSSVISFVICNDLAFKLNLVAAWYSFMSPTWLFLYMATNFLFRLPCPWHSSLYPLSTVVSTTHGHLVITNVGLENDVVSNKKVWQMKDETLPTAESDADWGLLSFGGWLALKSRLAYNICQRRVMFCGTKSH